LNERRGSGFGVRGVIKHLGTNSVFWDTGQLTLLMSMYFLIRKHHSNLYIARMKANEELLLHHI